MRSFSTGAVAGVRVTLKIRDLKMTDKLAGTRVSVLSVLMLRPLCQMAVRCVVHLLTWLRVCIFDVYLANYRKTLLPNYTNLVIIVTADIAEQ